MHRSTLTIAFALTAVSPLIAQGRRPAAPSDAAVRAAAATITEADYRQRIGVIADDSMRGRGTPSRELEEVATYIAGEFQRFGLRPGGDNGTFFQRYPIRRTQLDSTSFVMGMGRGAHGHWTVGRDAFLAVVLPNGSAEPQGAVSGNLVLIVGNPADTALPFGDVDLRGAIVVQVYKPGPGVSVQALIAKGRSAGARGWVLLTSMPGTSFASTAARALQPDVALGSGGGEPGIPVFMVRDSSAMELLSAAGEDLAALRPASVPAAVRALSGFTGGLELRRRVIEEVTAPNVIGVLEGSDPQLRNEYVFFTGHMDHVGVTGGGQQCAARGADSICNGADDDASGTTGVVMLAQAFARLNPRPRRTLVFMTVSGEERGLWGSQYYSEHPLVPLAQTVADLNIDMIGRNWRDTIAVIGKEHSDLGATANRITREHWELNMALVDDLWPNENFYYRSDHYNFARKGVPVLFFFNGVHADYHRVSDSVDKIDAEKAARIVQMVFHLGLAVANTTERPQWNAESRARIVQPATN